jgi:hypothetical protein
MFFRNVCWLPNNYIQLYPTVNVTVPLSLVKHEAVKKYGGNALLHLPSAPRGEKLLVSRTGRFTPGETYPDIHWTVGWEVPRTGSGRREERRSLLTLPGSSVVQPLQQPLFTPSYPASSSFSPYGLLEYRAPCFMIMLYRYTPASHETFRKNPWLLIAGWDLVVLGNNNAASLNSDFAWTRASTQSKNTRPASTK